MAAAAQDTSGPPAGGTSDAAVLRRFNRTYTQRIGVLADSFLGVGLPLGPARLLFEIGAGPTTARDLRARLGLDSGLLARQLHLLEERDLVAVVPDPADRRRRVVDLTRAGRSRRRRLDQRSEELAEHLLAPLTDRQRSRLTAALATAELLVRAATVELKAVDPASAPAVAAVRRFLVEIDRRFPQGYDVEAALAADAASRGRVPWVFVVATSDGEPVACGGLRTLDADVGEIKRMWVDDAWRGAGLGSRVLRRLEDEARAQGLGTVRLDTHRALTDAVAMYARAGYREIPRYNDNPDAQAWFERRLTDPA